MNVRFKTNCLKPAFALSRLLKGDYDKWSVEAEIAGIGGFECTVRCNVGSLLSRFMGKKLSEEGNRIEELIIFVKKEEKENKKEGGDPDCIVWKFEGIGKNASEPRIGTPASFTHRLKDPFVICPAYSACRDAKNPHTAEQYSKISDLSIIDKSIRPLVAALNTLPNIITRYSCRGHYFGPGPDKPFVIFQVVSPLDVMALHRRVMDAKTSYPWRLKCRVCRDGAGGEIPYAAWIIETNRKRTPLTGKRLDADITALAAAIRGLIPGETMRSGK